MRQVRMLTDFLIQIITKKKQGEHDDAKDIINTSIGEIFEVNDRDFDNLSLEQTLGALKDEAQSAEVLLATANILYERMELLNKDQARHCASQALLLYKKAANSSNTAFPMEDIHKMNSIQKQFEGSPKLAEMNKILLDEEH